MNKLRHIIETILITERVGYKEIEYYLKLKNMWIGYSNCIGFSYRPKGKHFQLLFNSVLPWSLFSLYIFCNGSFVKGLCSYGEYKNDCWFSYNANSIHINTDIMTYIHYITMVLGRFRNTLSIINTLFVKSYEIYRFIKEWQAYNIYKLAWTCL